MRSLLAYAGASGLAKTLGLVFRKAEGLSVVAEERTNSIILRGPEKAMMEVEALAAKLDVKEDAKKK